LGRLEGKVAIVTGGASGIGEATCERFVEEGATVVIADRNEALGATLAARLGPAAHFVGHDVTSEGQWKAMVEDTVARHGGLHVLVANAGWTILKTLEETTTDDWRAMFAVHADAVFFGCRHAFPEMLKSGGGAIITMSSNSAAFGYAAPMAYAAAKASQHGLVRSVAALCRTRGYKIRINAIMPGGIETPLVRSSISEMGRDLGDPDTQAYLASLGRPVDIANTCVFLASDEGRYVNGQILLVDGAMSHTQQ
jgi:NAD(P)-dependent dehydrogenase (short-subunit alcohol dehydrogenase family)